MPEQLMDVLPTQGVLGLVVGLFILGFKYYYNDQKIEKELMRSEFARVLKDNQQDFAKVL